MHMKYKRTQAYTQANAYEPIFGNVHFAPKLISYNPDDDYVYSCLTVT